jgi:YD repeat-containing protein
MVKMTLPDPDAGGQQVAGEFDYSFDEVGRVLTVTDPLSNVTENEYDVYGRRTKIIDAELGETDFTYDVAGNLLTLTDPVENTTTWVYDDLNRMIEETNELSDTRYFSYDAAGNLTKRIDRNNRKIEFVYDNLHRRMAERWGSNSAFPTATVSTTTEGGTIDEVQTVGFTSPNFLFGGTFTLTYDTQTTSGIAWDATAATVQSALEALSNIDSGDVSVVKLTNTSNSQTWEITFEGALAGTNVVQTTIDISSVQGYSVSEVETTDVQGGSADEVQVVTVSDATGGTFDLSFGGQTATLDHDSTAAEVETALENLSTIDNVTVTGNAGGPYTITFIGALSGANVAQLTPDGSLLTNSALSRTLSFAFDANNRLTTASDPAAEFTYSYDNLGRRTSVVHDLAALSFDVELISEYDAANNRTDLKALVDSTADFWN